MALVNLAIGFEVLLASFLSEIAVQNADASLAVEISEGTIGELGQGLAKKTFGHSLEERGFWGECFVETLGWMRMARNGVLRKAQMSLSFGGRSRNFANEIELAALF